ncbi:hypothetical protein HanIR_Chr08g0375981 [Helianthus annuus]|nr:hypothetical protein HanIR_Chr08g0375981 [Helianthus annuus]
MSHIILSILYLMAFYKLIVRFREYDTSGVLSKHIIPFHDSDNKKNHNFGL